MSGNRYINRFMVGASAISAQTFSIDSTWQPAGTNGSVTQSAYTACVSPMQPVDKLFRDHFTNNSRHTKAVNYYNDTLCSGAAWHYGDHYVVSLKGATAAVLDHCDLSQSVREQLLLEAARRATHGREVIALASGPCDQLPESLTTVRQLDFVGFVIIKPRSA